MSLRDVIRARSLVYNSKLDASLLIYRKTWTERRLFFLIRKVLATRQASDNKVYEVLHKDNKAHVVKINDCPRVGETQYGYVFFDKSVRTPGPVRRVDKVNLEFLLLYIRSFCKFHLKHRAAVACCGLANTIILQRFVIVLFYRCLVLWWLKRWTTATYTSLSLLLILISILPENWKLVAKLTAMKDFTLSACQ